MHCGYAIVEKNRVEQEANLSFHPLGCLRSLKEYWSILSAAGFLHQEFGARENVILMKFVFVNTRVDVPNFVKIMTSFFINHHNCHVHLNIKLSLFLQF